MWSLLELPNLLPSMTTGAHAVFALKKISLLSSRGRLVQEICGRGYVGLGRLEEVVALLQNGRLWLIRMFNPW